MYAASLVIIRGSPSRESDAGIFLSVAGRILRGDRLYVDVVDNKDPLFFYSYAGALAVGDWRTPFLLDVVWLAAAAASALLLLRAIGANRLTAAIGFIAYPLLLTLGIWYETGYSMLAALASVPLIGWLWIRGSFATAGALLGVSLLFKLSLALVLVSPLVAFLLLRIPAGPARSQIVRVAAGFGTVVAVAAAILSVRGELGGYLDGVIDNIAYSGDVLAVPGGRTGVLGHIEVVADVIGERRFAFFGAAYLMVGLLAAWTFRWRPGDSGSAHGPATLPCLASLFLSATVATAITLAFTAAWHHHLQMLAYPCLMLIAFLATVAREPRPTLPSPVAAGAVAGLVAAMVGLLAAVSHLPRERSISSWLETGRSKTAELLERVAEDQFPQLEEITFAHLGSNDEDAVAAFLGREWVLACPMIAQYYHSPDLSGALRCIRVERPCLLLITPTFTTVPPWLPSGFAATMAHAPAEWNRFLDRGSTLVGKRYERARDHETSRGKIEVFALRDRFVSPSC